MLKFFSNIVFLFSLALYFKYSLPVYDFILIVINLIIMHSYFKNEILKDNFFVLFYLVYLFCSCQVVALFELTSVGFFKKEISYTEYRQLSIWSTHLFFVIMTTLILLKPIFSQGNTIEIRTPRYLVSSRRIDSLLINFFIFVLCLQLLSLVFGLASNQFAASIVLPFHLNGLIDEIRSSIAAYVIVIYLFDRYIKKESSNKKVIAIYFIYAFMEVILRNSKGAFVYSFLPVIALMGVMGKIDKKAIMKVIIPLVVSLVILYPIVETARVDGQITVSSVIDAANNMESVDMSEKSSPYIRSFLTGVYYTKVVGEICNDELAFDFSHIPILLMLRGGSAYMTRIIDGIPEKHHHSSGITGLNDALLWGGYLLCYIVAALLAYLAISGDKAIVMRKNPLYKVILFFFFYDRLFGTTISFFIDSLLFSSIGTLLIKYFLTRYFYKKIY